MSAIAIPIFSRVYEQTHSTRLDQDIGSINRAVKLYASSGGAIPANNPRVLINRMKTAVSKVPGVTQRFLDPRVSLRPITNGPGMKWNEEKGVFERTETGPRYEVVLLGAHEIAAGGEEGGDEEEGEDLANAGPGSTFLNPDNGTWDSTDTPKAVQLTPFLASLGESVPDPGVAAPTFLAPPAVEIPGDSRQQLQAPLFSLQPGIHDIVLFPLPLQLTNPNTVGEMVYGVIDDDGIEFNPYTGGFTLQPGDKVVAYVSSPDPNRYNVSNLAMGKFKGGYFPKPLRGFGDEDTPVAMSIHPDVYDSEKIEIMFSITGITPPSKGSVTRSGGTITFNPGQDFQYLREGRSHDEVFSYEVINRDRSTASNEVRVTIMGNNDYPTLTGARTSTVSESALPGGTGGGTAVATGQLAVNDPDEGDTLTVSVNGRNVGNLNGLSGTTIATVEGALGNLQLRGNGAWSYTLTNNALHDADDSSFGPSESESFVIQVRDASGAVTEPASLNMNLRDDGITLAPVPTLTGSVEAGTVLAGLLDIKGADKPYTADLSSNIAGWSPAKTWAATTFTSGGVPVYYHVNPSATGSLIGYKSSSPGPYGGNAQQSVVFTLNADPVRKEYRFQTQAPFDNGFDISYAMSQISASGPYPGWIFTDAKKIYRLNQAVPAGERIIFRALPAISGHEINKNANYMGLNNMWVEPNEGGMILDLEQTCSSLDVIVNFSGGNTPRRISWVSYAANDSTVVSSGTFDGDSGGTVISVKPNQAIGKVALLTVAGSRNWQVGAISFTRVSGSSALDFSFAALVKDADGDTASTPLTFRLSNQANNAATITLAQPAINPSQPGFSLFNNSAITVTLTNPNAPGVSNLQYQIDGGSWTAYGAPFVLQKANHPEGAIITARAVSAGSPLYLPSPIASVQITAGNLSVGGQAAGTFRNPVGGSSMVTNLPNGASNSLFQWGSAPNAGQSKSWMQFTGGNFGNVSDGVKFKVGSIKYYNGSIASGTGANKVTLNIGLTLDINGTIHNPNFQFTCDLINTPNTTDPIASADYVYLASTIASQNIVFQGYVLSFQLEFGETTENGFSQFDKFHVLEDKDATANLYGTFTILGPQ